MRRLVQNISAFFLYFALTCIVFSGVIIGSGVFFAGDISQHYVPWETFVEQEFESARFPHWDPQFFAGHPIHAEGQSGTLYPITRLIYYWFDGAKAFSLDMLLHLALGGFFVYLLARRMNLGFYPSLYAGAVFTLAGYPVSLIVNAPILRSVAWIPLIINLVWGIWKDGGIRPAVWLAFAIATQIVAGSIQVVAMTLVTILFMSIFFLVDRIIRKKKVLTPIIFTALVGVALGFIIASAQIFPTFELYQQSFINLNTDDETSTYAFSPYHLFDLIIPPYWAKDRKILANESIPFQMTLFLYIGIVPFLMALIGIFMTKTSWTWRLMALFGILMGLGAYTFFYPMILKIIPPLNHFRAPDRFLAFYAIAASILAGYGFRYFLGREIPTNPKVKRKWWVFWGIVALVMFLIGIALDKFIPGMIENTYTRIQTDLTEWYTSTDVFANLSMILSSAIAEIIVAFAILLVLAVLTIKVGKSQQRALILGVAIFILSIAETGIYLKMNPGTKLISPDYFKTPPSSASQILRYDKEVFQNSENESLFMMPYRIDTIGYFDYSDSIFKNTPILLWYHGGGRAEDFNKFREILNPNYGNIFGFEYINGISSLYTWQWDQYMSMLEGHQQIFQQDPDFFRSRVHLWDVAGVRYIVSGQPLDCSRLENIYAGDVYVYRNLRALPRAFMLYPEMVLSEEPITMNSIAKGELDLSKNLVLANYSSSRRSTQSSNSVVFSPVTIRKYESRKVLISGVAVKDGYLFMGDAFYPGWECRINGEKTKISRAYGYFKAVPVKAGRFDAEFRFKPLSFYYGLFLSILGICSWMAIGVIAVKKGYVKVDDNAPSGIESEIIDK